MTNAIKQILNKVKKEITPSKEDEWVLTEKVGAAIKKLNSELKKINAIAVLGGSGEKKTWLKGTYEADIFVKFDYKKYSEKSNELSDMLEKKLKKIFGKIERIHGSRDYFQFKKDNFTFEIVPILGIKKVIEAKNITDVSPLHAKWVKKNSVYVAEIRLAKAFMNANNLYGAESYINGFSGYVCEVLTIYYRSFENLLRNAVKWKDKQVIDVQGYFKRKDALRYLNKSKTVSPLIVIDPVQADRNAAAALSYEKFELFSEKAKEFLKKPSMDFFVKKDFSIKEIVRKYSDRKIAIIEGKSLKGKEDVVGTKLLKVFEFLKDKISKSDFNLIDSGWHWDKEKAYFWFIAEKDISSIKKHIGPPIQIKKHAIDFKKKYKKTFVENGRVVAEIKAEFTNINDFVKELVKDEYVEERVKDAQVMRV